MKELVGLWLWLAGGISALLDAVADEVDGKVLMPGSAEFATIFLIQDSRFRPQPPFTEYPSL